MKQAKYPATSKLKLYPQLVHGNFHQHTLKRIRPQNVGLFQMIIPLCLLKLFLRFLKFLIEFLKSLLPVRNKEELDMTVKKVREDQLMKIILKNQLVQNNSAHYLSFQLLCTIKSIIDQGQYLFIQVKLLK